jgi:arylsulfatase A-like enzyme
MSKQIGNESKGVSRRDFIKTTGMGALAASLGSSGCDTGSTEATQPEVASRPAGGSVSAKPYNVMVILTDQEHYLPKLMGKGHWPGRDRLAKMGTTFENHQICSAVCTPSRSVIYTGQHIQHTRMFDNTNFPWIDSLSFDIPTIGHMMQDAGYYTTYHGKWHLNHDMDKPIKGAKKILIGHDIMEKYGYSEYNGLGDDIGMTLGGYHYDQVSTATAQGWLRRKGKVLNQEDKPWFLALGLVNPHDVMFYNTDQPGQDVQKSPNLLYDIAREPDDKIYKQKWDYPLSSSRKQPWDDPGRPHAHQEFQKCRQSLVGQFPNEDTRWKRLQDYYLNCISDCDRSVDRILTELDNLGMLDNTIVIFTADHGELCGAHGMHGKGANAFREQNNVPYIIYHPDIRGGGKCKTVTSHVDLIPTILAMTGADKKQKPEVMKNLHGHDISPVLKNPEKAPHDAIRYGALYCFNMWCYMDADWLAKVTKILASGEKLDLDTMPKPDVNKRSSIRTIFDGRYKFSRYFSPTQHNRPTTIEQIYEVNDVELYDLEEDPYEMHNLELDKRKNAKLIMTMNDKMNKLIDDEVGSDMGEFLPNIKNVNWTFDHFDI